MAEQLIHCWNCLGEFDALSAVWCSCNPNKPTKVCPFCLQCFCIAPESYHAKFWAAASPDLLRDREMLTHARGPLGEALVMAHAITSDQLLMALKRQKQTGQLLGEVLVELGFISKETLDVFLGRHNPVVHVSLKDVALDPMLIASIGAMECLKRLVVPMAKEGLTNKQLLSLAMASPTDGETIEFIQNLTGCQILPMRAPREDIEAALAPFVHEATPAGPVSAQAHRDADPAVQTAMDLVRKALARGASDLYLEPREEEVPIHLRIDGTLYRTKPIGRALHPSVVREIKSLLRLDTSVTDKPQEGRVVVRSGKNRYEVIAHFLPTRFGENVSLRFVHQDTFIKSFDQLGLLGDDQRLLRAALTAHSGLVLISAPLFNGGTTTLYSVMNHLASDGQRKVMSIEAHSVCPVPNITQVSLGENSDSEATLTTMKALGNIQPDVCVLADLLDSGRMASSVPRFAAHMLLVASQEANHAAHSVQAMIHLGYPPSDLAKQLLVVVNQRLVRRICDQCTQPTGLSERSLQLMGFTQQEAARLTTVSQGQGCVACSHIGYRGRIALFEILAPTADFRRAVALNPGEASLAEEAAKSGMTTLRDKALDAVQAGQTTIEEFQKGNF